MFPEHVRQQGVNLIILWLMVYAIQEPYYVIRSYAWVIHVPVHIHALIFRPIVPKAVSHVIAVAVSIVSAEIVLQTAWGATMSRKY